ncbi:MAG: leucine-rich repeat protein, partial [Treponema sp.]|nr:leucine-rich repeat protein [Treponema sp.]
MKTNTNKLKNKISLLLIAFLLAFTAASCSNPFTNTEESETGLAYISICAGTSRTILPDYNDMSMFTSFVLTGKTQNGIAEKTIATWTTKDQMTSSYIGVSPGTWTFTLTATYESGNESLVFSGSVTETLEADFGTTLYFTLSQTSTTLSGEGSYDFKISFQNLSSNKIDTVKAKIFKVENFPKGTPEETITYDCNQNTYSRASASTQTVSINGKLNPGTYVLSVSFFRTSNGNSYEIKSGYAESFVVKSKVTTKKEISIDSLESTEILNYNFPTDLTEISGNLVYTINYTQKIVLPTFKDLCFKKNTTEYVLLGWTDSNNTSITGWEAESSIPGKLTPVLAELTSISNAEGIYSTSFRLKRTEELEVNLPASGTWASLTGYVSITPDTSGNTYKLTVSSSAPSSGDWADVIYNNNNQAFYVYISDNIVFSDETLINNHKNYKYITSFTVPYGFTKIGNLAFSYADSLLQIKLPSTIDGIGTGCLGSDSATFTAPLFAVNFLKTENQTFASKIQAENDTFDAEEKTEYKKFCETQNLSNIVFDSDGNITSLKIPEGYKTIGPNLFYEDEYITKVTFPSTTKNILQNTLVQCPNLTSVIVLAETVPSLGTGGITLNNDSAKIYVPENSEENYKQLWESIIGPKIFGADFTKVTLVSGSDFQSALNTLTNNSLSHITSLEFGLASDNDFNTLISSLTLAPVDVSASGSGEALAYYNETTEAVYIAALEDKQGFCLNEDCAEMFWGFSSCEQIKGLNYVDSSNTTSFSLMFQSCENLTELDLSGFDTKNAEAMDQMFTSCYALTSL